MSAPNVFAHAKWFVDPQLGVPDPWGELTRVAALASLGVTLVVAVTLIRILRSPAVAGHVRVERLRVFRGCVPRLLACALGLSWLGLAATGRVWLPSIDAADVPAGRLMLLVEAALGAWLAVGIALVPASFAVLAVTAVVALVVDPVAVLENGHVPASAAALLVMARSSRRPGRAAMVLRTGIGVGLITVAITEKLAAPGITEAVVQAHGELNVLRAAGVGDGAFTLIAGCVELLLGALLLSGAAVEALAPATVVPFVATLPLFGVTELIGHLPIYGALVAIAVLSAGDRAPAPDVSAARVVPHPNEALRHAWRANEHPEVRP
jgi:hypothetical protein